MTYKATVYSKPGCIHCTNLKRSLIEMGVAFEEIDVSKDQEAYLKVTEDWGYRQVPVLEFDGDTWVNPTQKDLDDLLWWVGNG